jgi:hypothetical protein
LTGSSFWSRNEFKDNALDSQYQYIGERYLFTMAGTRIKMESVAALLESLSGR